ncbi:unnamed protein product [Dovyalis caffra]|uniref:Uncharacterized protein n=1 Tax=Dovyalis caffra TaxID=77055 RepID=A0AAV1RGX1_9ROSI|nr:unnamed protein product [Dovyalis caffra]
MERHASRKHLRIEDSIAVNERAAKLLESMVREEYPLMDIMSGIIPTHTLE